MENQVSPANPVNQQPASVTVDVVQQQSPQQQNKLQGFFLRFSLRQIFNLSSWTLLFLLAPFTVFVLISQKAVPGDAFYPLKRRLEDVVLVAAAAHPATRVAFRTNLTKRRFGEAETLLLARLDTEGLNNFVEEVQAARNEAEAISDPVKKEELVKELNNSLTEYAQRLITVRQQVASRTQPPSQPSSDKTPQTQPVPLTNTPIPVPTTRIGQVPQATNTPVPLPTNVSPSEAPTPQPTTPEVAPTAVPNPPSPSNPTDKIDQTLEYLTCLKRKSASECTPPARSRSVHEEREERREAREERREERQEEKRERQESQEEKREVQREQRQERRGRE